MFDNDNNADVPEQTPVVEQPIPAGVMIPEHNTDSDELLDADKTSGGDDEPLPKHGQGGTICCGQCQCVHTRGGCRGHGICTCARGGRDSVSNGRARQDDNPNWTWKKINQTHNNDDTETISMFSENEGLCVRIKETPNVVELYLTDEILTYVVNETNRYAHLYLKDNPKKADSTYLSTWTDTDILEMKRFFGLVILIEIIHKPNRPMYWSADSLYHTPVFKNFLKL